MLREVYRPATQRLLWTAAYRAFSTALEGPVPRYAAGLGIFALALALCGSRSLPLQGGNSVPDFLSCRDVCRSAVRNRACPDGDCAGRLGG